MMDPLQIHQPSIYDSERRYVAEVLFGEFLGIPVEIHRHEEPCTKISFPASDAGVSLVLVDDLFQTDTADWLTSRCLPRRPLRWWEVPPWLELPRHVPRQIPLIYPGRETAGPILREEQNGLRLSFDLFGGVFYALTRLEEFVSGNRDRHGRFPAGESLAVREGFLQRPVVNEYLELLWSCLRRLWPALSRGARSYRLLLSHDVDHPSAVARRGWPEVLRNAIGDTVVRRDPFLAARRLVTKAIPGAVNRWLDPYNTFEFIMRQSERHGIRSAFNFMTVDPPGPFDGTYSLNSTSAHRLIRAVVARGHEIGLHPGYDSLGNHRRLAAEFDALRRAVSDAGGRQRRWGGRQHYLRWDARCTWSQWDEVGLDYDSSVGYPDQIGFRCGTCYEFTTFDLQRRVPLRLREQPLIAMDVSLMDRQYMNLSARAALRATTALSRVCRSYGGDFALLWHNSHVASVWQKRLYRQTLKCVV